MENIKAKISVFLNSVYGCGSGYGCDTTDDIGSDSISYYGSGAGIGSHYGCGTGYCHGDHTDSGFGDGLGSGAEHGNYVGNSYRHDGYHGIKSFGGADVHCIDDVCTVIYNVKGNIARGAIIRSDFTLLPCYIAKVDGCFAHDETAHKAYESAVAKALLDEPIEQRVARFVAKYPDPDAKIPAKELFDWHNILTGSCGMGRREFARAHNIDIDAASFTANEFIELTIRAYGGENIAQLKQSYNNH